MPIFRNSSTQFFLIGFPLFELDGEYLFMFSPRNEDGYGASQGGLDGKEIGVRDLEMAYDRCLSIPIGFKS